MAGPAAILLLGWVLVLSRVWRAGCFAEWEQSLGAAAGRGGKRNAVLFFACNTPIPFWGIFFLLFYFGVTPEYVAGGSRSFRLLSWTSAMRPPGLCGFASLVSAHVQAP